MEHGTEQAVFNYMQVHQKLYQRNPKELKTIDEGWVLLNGARLRIVELEYLTEQLQKQYEQQHDQKKTMLQKLIRWFKN